MRAAKKDLATSAAAPSLPPDATLVSPPKPPSAHPRPRAFPPRIAPHRVYSPNTHPLRPQTCCLLLRARTTPPSPPNRPPMGGNQRVQCSGIVSAFGGQARNSACPVPAHKPLRSKQKEKVFRDLQARSEAAQSFDNMASTFKGLVQLMRDYMSSALTAACFAALDALESRLVNHHEIPRTSENSDSYSALLGKTVTMPIQAIEQVRREDQAAPNTWCDLFCCSHHYSRSAPASPEGEIFGLPYHQIIPRVNVVPEKLVLLKVLFASRLNASSSFLVPEST
ncbi:hypothetical protein FB451DRAFT_1516071 [Mycena latifolia]|nr:hypothetical protein FB451DRAFT_1516071 [Mycena latifolia]